MGLIQSKGSADLREVDERAVLAAVLYNQFQDYHALDIRNDKDIEQMLIDEKQRELDVKDAFFDIPKNTIVFSPSSVSKCPRELYFKAKRYKKDELSTYPYQRRWMRNGTAVHEYTQRDLLYMEKYLPEPKFVVKRTRDGLPAWENNIKTHKIIHHNGETFAMFGMMDGILEYTPDKSTLGFEFKTKSTTIASVGTYLMKDAQDDHKLQATAYSILFGMNEFIFMYESLAKDGWMKGEEARPDVRTFYLRVKEEDKIALLDKLAEVCKAVRDADEPDCNPSKAIFCQYKSLCKDCSI